MFTCLGAPGASHLGTWETFDLNRSFPGNADIPATGNPGHPADFLIPVSFPEDGRSQDRVLGTEREQIFIPGDKVVGL